MAQITEDYCSFELSKLLKEKGFDSESITAYYFFMEGSEPILNRIEPQHFVNLCGGNISLVGCPTLQMAMKWLREVHKLHITILWDCGAYIGKDSFCYHIDRINNYEDKGYNKIGFDSNEQACEAAIKYCLENLI